MQPASNFLAQGRILITNKVTPIGTISGGEDPAVKFLQVASVVAARTYPAGVMGHYFVLGEVPMFSLGEPMRANFGEAEDAIIFCFKQSGNLTYLYGITVENLIVWQPPAKAGDPVTEDGLLQTWKSSHADLKSLEPLVNTETHKLRDLAVKLMSHMPSFKVHQVRSACAGERATPHRTRLFSLPAG